MGRKELKKREKWQDSSGQKSGVSEKIFYEVLSKEFKGIQRNSKVQI